VGRSLGERRPWPPVAEPSCGMGSAIAGVS
jgi:hypothetical protein